MSATIGTIANNGSTAIKTSRPRLLLVSSALATIMLASAPAFAQTASETGTCRQKDCMTSLRGKALDNSSSGRRETEVDEPAVPFQISVDGETVDKSAEPSTSAAGATSAPASPAKRPVDAQRRTDVDLSAVDIQVKYDGLEKGALLNVSTMPVRRTYQAGEPVEFLATANYPAFIERSEIRIYEQGREKTDAPIATLPVSINGVSGWTMPAEEEKEFSYVLRVYDAEERYDETLPLTIARTEQDLPPEAKEKAVAPGMGEDRTALRNIPISGGAVTVYGRNVPPGYSVEALGEVIPIDPDQAFVVQRILPAGDHKVGVAVKGPSRRGGLRFNRSINIPDNDWFYVALADLTVGKRMGDDNIETVRPGEYDNVYSKGRIAFYLKGKIKGKYLLTASADSNEENIEDLFRNLDKKDPRQLLRRLDPDDYYPVYGDDSTFVEDAPTKGKFYVRLERGDSHVMWGSYKTIIDGTEFLHSERELYGASAVYRSPETTSFGERKTEVTLYAAEPDTLPQREEFLGTGGSAYFLKRQDITIGSETITIEFRDEVTGRVIERRILQYGQDYSFDYTQGVLILRRPLSSTTATNGPVRQGALGGNRVVLIAQYEFTPAVGDVDGYVYGGRAQQWLNERLRVGVTGMNETTGPADQRAVGADIQLRHSEKTFLNAEIAHSKGPGFGLSRSTDGGLTWGDEVTAGDPNRAATAWRVEGQAALEELHLGGMKGRVGGYYDQKEAGFSTLADNIYIDQRIWGAHADLALTDHVGVALTYDDFRDDEGQTKRDGTSSVSWELDEYWKVTFGLRYTDLMSPLAISSGKSGYDGSRLDGGVRVDYKWDDEHLIYVFGQGTLDRSGDIDRNDRIGVGAEIKLTDKIGLEGEVSYGTHGVGALAAVTYDPTADDHYYLGYKLDPDRSFDLDNSYDLIGSDKGAIVVGLKRRMSDIASAYSEANYDMFGDRRSLTQTYGVVYTPDSVWTFDGGLEVGRVRDDTVDADTSLMREDFDRYAPSLSIGYKDEEAGIGSHVRGEVRVEDSQAGTRDQNSYLFAAGLSWKTNEDWRLLASVDAVLSDSTSTETSFQDTDYVEASFGYAYRPVDNDRLNGLFKYTWLYDMPGNNQLVSGATEDLFAPAQLSHIVSADVIYDLMPWLSIGGKYGFRFGEVKNRADGGEGTEFEDVWQRSTAHLGIVRTDVHIVKSWDLLLEGRVLHMPEAETTDYGALAAVYRHVGDNFKVGVGYNFGSFSDDLRDLTLNDEGMFLNVVGKF
ncbi:TonB-dependent receptor [Mesorhizobium caraganae]|uniref:TonB-dependent receptor n=1 Tax=Mesorhizobium caraganae TaxID=483206 RepID=UPI00193959A5|nr:TonB-dependent receptor [Mesorhizobium caraganae]MBM2709969.1 TonB-dependent receptor [Mesorhizobium caraganae]